MGRNEFIPGVLTTINTNGIRIIFSLANQLIAMKKFIYPLFLFAFFITSSCNTNNVAKIDSGVKAITKCCTVLSNLGSKTCCSNEETETKPEEPDNYTLLLPVNSWDTKMMIF